MTKTVIVIPCYNEFARLPLDAFKEYGLRGEGHSFLFVDDGSTDATGELLEDLNRVDEKTFKVLRLGRNCGKGEAVRQGFLAALNERPAYIGYWDADLATPLDAIPNFCTALDESPALEIVMGARVILLGHAVERRIIRHYLGRISATVASLAVGIRVYDAMCGAKCFRVTPRTTALFASPFHSRWVFDAEWLARFVNDISWDSPHSLTTAICEMPLREWREVLGSKLRWRDYLWAMVDLGGIFLRYRCRLQRDAPAYQAVQACSLEEASCGSDDRIQPDAVQGPTSDQVPGRQ